MCKIAAIPMVNNKNRAKVKRLMRSLQKEMTKNDQEGFGYMAVGSKGLYGEKWLNPVDAWSKGKQDPNQKQLGILNTVLEREMPYDSFGHNTNDFTSVALHARMATCEKSIENTHPFVTEDRTVGLIHNGIISNHHRFKKSYSTCDSEALLTQYLASDVANFPKQLSTAMFPVEGWFAAAVFAKRLDGQWVLDLFRDDHTPIEAVYVPAVGGLVFCTKADMVVEACRALGWKIGERYTMHEAMHVRFNARTGVTLSTTELTLPEPKDVKTEVIDMRYDGWRPDYEDDAPSYREDRDTEPVDARFKDPFWYKRDA